MDRLTGSLSLHTIVLWHSRSFSCHHALAVTHTNIQFHNYGAIQVDYYTFLCTSSRLTMRMALRFPSQCCLKSYNKAYNYRILLKVRTRTKYQATMGDLKIQLLLYSTNKLLFWSNHYQLIQRPKFYLHLAGGLVMFMSILLQVCALLSPLQAHFSHHHGRATVPLPKLPCSGTFWQF